MKENLSPIAWIGGKFYQRKKLISLFPPHKIYCEPFGGSGIILFTKPHAPIEIYNDKNELLVNFFLMARDYPEKLIERIDTLPYSRALFQKLKQEPLPDDPIEKAAIWFYILMSSFSCKYGDGWAASGITKNTVKSFRNSTQRIKNVQTRFKNVMVESADFRNLFKYYDSKESFFFCDPPYLAQSINQNYYGKEHNNSVEKFTEKDHIDLADLLNNVQGKVMLCGYPTELYKNLYSRDKWVWERYTQTLYSQRVTGSSQREKREEILIMNYKSSYDLFLD